MKGKTKDGINFLRKQNLKRIWNAGLVFSSYYISRVFKTKTVWGKPLSISYEPTTSCNLRCPECPSGLRQFTRPTGMLEFNRYKQAVDEFGSSLMYLLFYFQGEPYLNTRFLDMVKYASERNIYTATSTNAHYLKDDVAKKTVESGLDRLIISIDGTTQETYQSYRIGGKLEKVLEGTKNIVKWKKELNSSTPHLIFQFLVVKPNEHQIDDVYQLADEIGVDEVRLKTAQIYDYENGNDLIPTIDKYSRYKKMASGKYKIKNKLYNHCWRMWHACVITWDGLVVPCCFDKDAENQLGDLKDKSFTEIWNDEKYKDFRGRLMQGRKNIEICKNCTEGTKVWG
jgi:radical SAM protein with 4Fe4S-binding SPASM domain